MKGEGPLEAQQRKTNTTKTYLKTAFVKGNQQSKMPDEKVNKQHEKVNMK